MSIYLLLGGTFLFIILAFLARGPVSSFQRFRHLNTLVSTGKSVPKNSKCRNFHILWLSIHIIMKAYYNNILQHLGPSGHGRSAPNWNVKKIDKNRFEVTYSIRGKVYKMVQKNRRGPIDIMLVHDEDKKDVNSLILPYYGPNLDFHNSIFIPAFWGKKKLSFYMTNDRVLNFNEHEEIKLN